MALLRRRLPYLVAILLGVGLCAAARLPLVMTDDRLAAWGAIGLLTLIMLTGSGLHLFRSGGILRSVRLAVPALFLCVSAFLYLLIIETTLALLGLVALTTFLTAVYYESLRRSLAGPDQLSPANLVHLSFVLDAVSLFFTLAFVFGFAAFYYVSLPAAALAVGLVAAFLTHEMLWRAGFDTRSQFVLVAAAGVIGAEIYAALSLLPTSYLVNAAVSVVLMSAALHVVRQVLSGAGELRFFRRELAASLLLAVILLTTARWA